VDKHIGNFYIPKGTSICISTYHLNTCTEVWGDDAQTFRPERFKEIHPNKYRHAFWQYGLGPRQCLGKHFAVLMVKLVLFMVLRGHKLETITEIGYDRSKFVVTPTALFQFTPLSS
jgi:cytochrome P450